MLLWGPLSAVTLPTASRLCFLWLGLGGPHTFQGSYCLSEPTHLCISSGGGSCSSQQYVGSLGEVLRGLTPTPVLAQA